MKRVILCIAAVSAIASAAYAAETTIGQKDKQFSKASITLKKGDKLHFTNDDSVTHDISVKDPDGHKKPGIIQKPGDQTDLTFDQAGDFTVMCLIHPKMKMTVQVQ
jgi:cytochrome c peroxidase